MTLDDVITVGQLYTDTKLALLRFYLTTKKKKKESPHSHSSGLAPSLERQESSQNQSSTSPVSVATGLLYLKQSTLKLYFLEALREMTILSFHYITQ